MRTWKVGDLAMVAWTTSKGRPRVDICLRHPTGNWLNGEEILIADDGAVLVRPLVAIDPEERGQVEAMRKALECNSFSPWNTFASDHLQAALRSLLAPDRPEEPTGLGAVVEDEDGDQWVRFKSAERAPWRLNRHGDVGLGSFYADITAVRILSPGVTDGGAA